MKAKIYVVLRDYDNGEDYEDRYTVNREFVAVSGSKEEAHKAIWAQVSAITEPYDQDNEDDYLIAGGHKANKVTVEEKTFYNVTATTEFYIEEKEVEIPD